MQGSNPEPPQQECYQQNEPHEDGTAGLSSRRCRLRIAVGAAVGLNNRLTLAVRAAAGLNSRLRLALGAVVGLNNRLTLAAGLNSRLRLAVRAAVAGHSLETEQ